MKLIEYYKQAAAASGRNVLSLIWEALRLRASAKKLGLTEYIDFQLFKQDLPWKVKLAFGGQRAQAAIEEVLIDDYSRFLSLDKVTMYALLSGSVFQYQPCAQLIVHTVLQNMSNFKLRRTWHDFFRILKIYRFTLNAHLIPMVEETL
jgi:hypothetical protein